MDSTATMWWVAAGVLVAAELATGSFYLLMVALGLAAGALAAHLGLTFTLQVVIAALAGSGTTALWHFKRYRSPRSAPAQTNRDVNLDISEQVHIPAWAEDRTARIQYRGSTWTVKLVPGVAALSGQHVVAAVEGNWLIVTPLSAASTASADLPQ